jgi:uncharacterized membrane protein YdjX (TVP38/TMEM64 family)
MTVKRREYLWLALVGGVLITAVLFVRAHSATLGIFVADHPIWGVLLYIVLNVLDAVVAPGATLPLIPVAVQAWGRTAAALVTTAGWTAGSLVAFSIARRWGLPMVRKLTSMERLRRMKRYIPENLFVSVAVLRLISPMDVISYLLGLFTDIAWPEYVAATALGLTPSAFVLAYLGKLSHAYDLIAFGIVAAVVIGYVTVARRRR